MMSKSESGRTRLPAAWVGGAEVTVAHAVHLWHHHDVGALSASETHERSAPAPRRWRDAARRQIVSRTASFPSSLRVVGLLGCGVKTSQGRGNVTAQKTNKKTRSHTGLRHPQQRPTWPPRAPWSRRGRQAPPRCPWAAAVAMRSPARPPRQAQPPPAPVWRGGRSRCLRREGRGHRGHRGADMPRGDGMRRPISLWSGWHGATQCPHRHGRWPRPWPGDVNRVQDSNMQSACNKHGHQAERRRGDTEPNMLEEKMGLSFKPKEYRRLEQDQPDPGRGILDTEVGL